MLKLRLIDEGRIVAEQKGEIMDDFDNIIDDLKKKYPGRK